MNKRIFPIILALNSIHLYGNIYVSLYATKDGHTGHIGIAVDNYDIKINDRYVDGIMQIKEDSICNGTITYFDFWPKKSIQGIWMVNKKFQATYLKYPKSDFDDPYYLEDLYFKGIPYKICRRPDGLLRIKSNAIQDYRLKQAVDSLIQVNKNYQALHYNCTDFITEVLNLFYGFSLPVKKERILFAKFSTPNKLFAFLQSQQGSRLLIDPQNKIKGSFLLERFIKRFLYRKRNFEDKITSVT